MRATLPGTSGAPPITGDAAPPARHSGDDGYVRSMSPIKIRPLGGAVGCLVMILVSVVLSVVVTVLLNWLI